MGDRLTYQQVEDLIEKEIEDLSLLMVKHRNELDEKLLELSELKKFRQAHDIDPNTEYPD